MTDNDANDSAVPTLHDLIREGLRGGPAGGMPPALGPALAAANGGSRAALSGWAASALAAGAQLADLEATLTSARQGLRAALDAAAASGGWPADVRLAREQELGDLFACAGVATAEATLGLGQGAPVIQVWDGVLVMPLVGALTAERSRQLMRELLEGIIANQADVTILDLTGVSVIDTEVANRLLKTVRAARLLGTWPLVTGLSPAIAQTLVQLGLETDELEVEPNLFGGLQKALASLDLHVAPAGA